MASHQDNLLELGRKLQEVQDFVNNVKDPLFGSVRLRMNQHLLQDINWVSTMTGNASALGAAVADGTNPLLAHHLTEKRIMGKLVGDGRAPVTADTLIPSNDEKAKFGAKVNDLYNSFLGLKDKDIIAIAGKPGGGTVIRGVAKKAGLPNWDSIDSSELDLSFFADIRAAIKEQNLGAKLNADIAGKLDEEDAANEAPAPKTVTAKKSAMPKKVAAKKPVFDDDDDDA